MGDKIELSSKVDSIKYLNPIDSLGSSGFSGVSSSSLSTTGNPSINRSITFLEFLIVSIVIDPEQVPTDLGTIHAGNVILLPALIP